MDRIREFSDPIRALKQRATAEAEIVSISFEPRVTKDTAMIKDGDAAHLRSRTRERKFALSHGPQFEALPPKRESISVAVAFILGVVPWHTRLERHAAVEPRGIQVRSAADASGPPSSTTSLLSAILADVWNVAGMRP
jgi:hypothetical protein